MKKPSLFSIAAGLLLLASISASFAQAPAPNMSQYYKTQVAVRRQRVDLLRDEIKQTDARIETRLDAIVNTLKTVTDSNDSRTKVARMKEETGKRLMQTIRYYDQKRAALKEELRNPRLNLTAQEKEKMIAIFDARIEKRTNQILDLNKSMPTHEDHERYKVSGGGWWGTEYQRNEEYEQNRRMTSHTNTQRDVIIRQLDASIARLDRQARTLRMQVGATSDPAESKLLGDELARTDKLIAERRQQKLETLKPVGGTATHTVALKEAMDMDKAMQTAVSDLRRDFNTLFARYNTLLNELSLLHSAEAGMAAQAAR